MIWSQTGDHGGMTLLQTYRAENPQTEFLTRPLECPDGITRIVSLGTWYWEKLETLLALGRYDLEYITGFCFDLALRSAEEEGWDFDHAFHELLMYYIYRHYTVYHNYRRGIANDNAMDCFS